jgi:hypothetical protein
MKLGSLMCPSQVIRLNEQNLLLDQLIQFIWGYRKDDNCIAKLTAGAIASASFGSQHLWQDLGLAGREEVTYLLESYFPNLASRNVNNFKWKKFLFMELGIAIGVKNLRPPKCKGCDQFKVCFP